MALGHPLEPVLQPGRVVARLTQAKYALLSERLEYTFGNRALIRLALTHASSSKSSRDYQRLEFLGDRVLGLIVAEALYRRNPGHAEGRLSPLHSSLVRREACAEAAKRIGLQDFILLGQKEAVIRLNEYQSVLGDVMEAVIAAIYLDGGLEPVRRFVLKVWEPMLATKALAPKDAKTFLQEWTLGRGLGIPVYQVRRREGPDHAPTFEVEVVVERHDTAAAAGASKRLAEQAAASAFIEREKLRT